MTEFDPLHCPLDSINLIEAGAGTGKTYSIQTLFLRLLIQKEIPVQHILVVTFTEAATAELRERIRLILNKLRLFLMDQLPASDKDYARLAAIAVTERSKALQHTIEALRNFDQSAISTIHGFCRRMLSENAFETSMRYGVELKKEVGQLYLELLNDFCRHHLYQATGAERELNTALGLDPSELAGRLRNVLGKTLVNIYWGDTGGDSAAAAADIRALFLRLQALDAAAVLDETLTMFTGGNRDKYAGIFAGLTADEFAVFDYPPQSLAGLDYDFLFESVSKRPDNRGRFAAWYAEHEECFTLLDQLVGMLNCYWRTLLKSAYEFVQNELAERKRKNNFLTFDDLLIHLRQRLADPAGGTGLAKVIRERFAFALLDEFQDTDPVQFEIFYTIFGNAGGESAFFMIGDPKQAIYNFRGGDIFAYLSARHAVAPERCYTLSVNYRSTRKFINEVNAFYQRQKHPFALDEIAFHPIGVPDKAPAGGVGDGLHFYWCDDVVAGAVGHVTRLLAAKVPPADIAVLVMNSSTGNKVERALRELNLPVDWNGKSNIFDTSQARDLLLLLRAAADPGDGALAAMLAAGPFGRMSAVELDRLQQSGEFAQWRTFVYTAGKLWSEQSFMAMFHYFLSASGAGVLLAQSADGERQLANFFQLAELLHQAASERRLGPAGLTAYLSDRIHETDKESGDEVELRTSSSRPAITILTVHKSKGLEFAYVILPDIQARSTGDVETFHDDDGRRIMRMADDDYGVARGKAEALQEFLRFLYVGITRAVHDCCVLLKPLKDKTPAKMSAMDYICRFWDQTSLPSADELMAKLSEIPADVSVLAATAAPEAAAVTPELPEAGQQSLQTFDIPLVRGWQTGSFTSLTAQNHAALAEADDLAGGDYDALTDGEQMEDTLNPEPVFQLPAGARFGICCHKIFEEIEFDANAADIFDCVSRNCEIYLGADASVSATVGEMVKSVLNAPLPEGFSLSQIPRRDRLSELKFSYRLNSALDSGRLQALALDSKLAGDAGFALSPGVVLTGEIDLVFRRQEKFYLVDWKTNIIGGDSANFSPDKLGLEMAKNQYRLQYLIYLAGFFRFLSSRRITVDREFYERNFGGVYYLFLRGVSPSHPGRGIYFDKPNYALLEALIHEIC